MIRRPPRSTRVRSSAASDVYKRQDLHQRSAARTGGRRDVPRGRLRAHPGGGDALVGVRYAVSGDPARRRRGGEPTAGRGGAERGVPARALRRPAGSGLRPARRAVVTTAAAPDPLAGLAGRHLGSGKVRELYAVCLLYTSDAADDLTRVDLG